MKSMKVGTCTAVRLALPKRSIQRRLYSAIEFLWYDPERKSLEHSILTTQSIDSKQRQLYNSKYIPFTVHEALAQANLVVEHRLMVVEGGMDHQEVLTNWSCCDRTRLLLLLFPFSLNNNAHNSNRNNVRSQQDIPQLVITKNPGRRRS